MTTPPECQALEAQHNALTAQIADLNAHMLQGPDDPHPGKPDPETLAEKRQAIKELDDVNKQFESCMVAHGRLPDLYANFAGNVTLTIQDPNPKIKGPFHLGTTIRLVFWHWDRTTLQVVSFPPVSVGPFDAGPGTDTITVTMIGAASGGYASATGTFWLTLGLHFHHSAFGAGDSDISVHLSSANAGGAALDAAGNVTISGTATFRGGYLGDDQATFLVAGNITPHP